MCVAYKGEEVILQSQSVHRLQAEVSDAWEQTLQHGRAVLDAIEAHSAGVDLENSRKTSLSQTVGNLGSYHFYPLH